MKEGIDWASANWCDSRRDEAKNAETPQSQGKAVLTLRFAFPGRNHTYFWKYQGATLSQRGPSKPYVVADHHTFMIHDSDIYPSRQESF